MEYATYTPKTPAAKVATSEGWADFDNAPDKWEVYRRQVIADGLVEPKLMVADVAIEDIPNGAIVHATFGTRTERFYKKNGQWTEGGMSQKDNTESIIKYVLKDSRATEWPLTIPVAYWYLFQS